MYNVQHLRTTPIWLLSVVLFVWSNLKKKHSGIAMTTAVSVQWGLVNTSSQALFFLSSCLVLWIQGIIPEQLLCLGTGNIWKTSSLRLGVYYGERSVCERKKKSVVNDKHKVYVNDKNVNLFWVDDGCKYRQHANNTGGWSPDSTL